jgi:coenzyme PQQ precursor peptide PqqA
MLLLSRCISLGAIVQSSPNTLHRAAGSNRRFHQRFKETNMKWETPTACDFRFGFEITMYIAAR